MTVLNPNVKTIVMIMENVSTKFVIVVMVSSVINANTIHAKMDVQEMEYVEVENVYVILVLVE